MSVKGWHLKHVKIEVQEDGQTYTFECNKWFDVKEGDGLIERYLEPLDDIENGINMV